MIKISDVWTFEEWQQSVDNQRKEVENMKKSLNWKEFYKLALRNKEIFPYLTANELYCLDDEIFCSSMCHKKDFEWGC